MSVQMISDKITARGMFFCGFFASPPTWMHISNPASAKMTPSGSAAKTPWNPYGANPPPAVKLEAWNLVVISATTVSSGMKTFQITATALVSDSHFTPIALITTNTSRNPAPAKMPRPVSRPLELMKCRPV